VRVLQASSSCLPAPRSRAEYDYERSRFLQQTVSARAAPAIRGRRWRPPILLVGGIGLGRTARAAMSALLVAMRSLPRARCDDCNAWVELDYRYCPACGARLRGATPLIAGGRG